MAIADRIKRDTPLKGTPVPPRVEKRLVPGREDMRKDHPLRRVCMKFWQGQHYWYVDSQNQLRVQPSSVVPGPGQLKHRIRKTYNFAASVIENKVSQATQRVPGYEVTPSNNDPDVISASEVAAQVARFGYDKWGIRRVTTKMVTGALVERERFALPYFDPNVGPFIETLNDNGEMEYIGMGEVKVATYSRSEVMWEPGVDFTESRWYATEQATVLEEVEELEGFCGGTLKADATTSDLPSEKTSENMVILTKYFERPCKDYPHGRFLTIANGKVILPEDQYPVKDPHGEVLDEPVLHRLSYTVNPEGDDLGLMERLIDLTQTINDCWNKLLEWKNRCLLPQMMAPYGSNMAPRDDTPGAINLYNLIGGQKPDWEPTPQVPRELFDMLNMAIEHLRSLAADVDIQADPNVAARTANTAIETAKARWQSFLGDLAEFHSRLMRHLLSLVARHYTEERMVDILGQYAWETIPSFTGRDLMSQVNVRVSVASLEAKSRQAIQDQIAFMQANFPGALSAEAAWLALESGTSDGLLGSYQNDVARADRMVKLIRQGPDVVLAQPMRFDPALGDPMQGMMVPAWMPRKQDNIAVWKQRFGDYMKTPDFEKLDEPTQAMFDQVWEGLEWAEKKRAMDIVMQQQNTAAELGLGNAAAPQSAAPMPSQPSMTPQEADPAALSPGKP